MESHKGKWMIANCVIQFDRLKGVVKTESGHRLVTAGEWFQCLIDDASQIRAKWMAVRRPAQLSRFATDEEIAEHFKTKEK